LRRLPADPNIGIAPHLQIPKVTQHWNAKMKNTPRFLAMFTNRLFQFGGLLELKIEFARKSKSPRRLTWGTEPRVHLAREKQ
jgi:hypothetical protein